MSSSKRMVSSVQITLAPPWRAELSQKNQPRNPEPTRADYPPGADSWQEGEALQNGDLLTFRSTFLDEIPTDDCLSLDLPPPPPSPLVLPLSPKRVPLDPSPAPIPDSLSLELQKLDLTRPPPSQRPLKTTRPLSDNQEKREEAAPGKQSVNGHKGKQEGSDICAFCHKTIPPSTATIEAMKKQYHAGCFTCRKCHRLLAGQMYYQKDGQPICEHCYKETLEKCGKCDSLILQHIVRALGSSYHPECFTCVVCSRTIADESFAVDEFNDVHCAEDYYRKYAPICTSCRQPIIAKNGQDSYKIECMGHNYHENCYRCANCGVLLSLEPTDSGCFPLKGRLMCKSCHLSWKDEVS
ncbi:filamin-binding LIM protein 1 isoform X2 [Phyllobates terribilis]|uniref:filamin-binding LIM protein 1 isoform X2 n=1 Tax=Phyllobates terribilis TaxID=111132 RepID=UPI003CCA7D59